MKKGKTFIDKFNRTIHVIYWSDGVWQVTVDGWLISDREWILNKQRMIITISSKLHTGQPDWWEFWRKDIDPTITFKLP